MSPGSAARSAARALALVSVVAVWALAPVAQAEPRFAFAATPGKLPKDVVPKHYALRIEPAEDRFDGEVTIDLSVAREVPALVLNAADLAFKSAKLSGGGRELELAPRFDAREETVTLRPSTGPIPAGDYRLRIAYSGKIARFYQGLYRFRYRQNEGGRAVEKTMLATHMEPVSARRLFPGWDEPAFRASFEIAAVVEAPLTVVSNMPQAESKPLPDGRKEVRFEPSVPMPTYLVALFIGEMDVLEDSVDGIALRIYTARGKTGRARYAMDATKQLVHFYNDYFGERYPLAKLDQLALPGGGGGAMENWGAIAYSEARLLYDPRRDSVRQLQGNYGIIAHELAHQWFGNLVTMAWWDNLWLNEGFATWMAEKTTDRFNPEWGMRLRHALRKEGALGEDARRSTHPIQTPVESDIRAMDVFDSISYAKGAAVLRMLEAALGEDVFRAGIRRYLGAHRYSNTTTADLWHHLSQVSGRDVADLMSGWTVQPGYPVVKLSTRCRDGSAEVALAQERFTLNDPDARPLSWNVPVVLAAEGSRRTVLLDAKPQTLRLPGCGPILANAGDAGYYRVEYDDALFRRLAGDLAGLEPIDRQRFLADTLALVKAGRADATRYLGLVEALGEESERAIWDEVIGSLRFFANLIADAKERDEFERYIVRVLQKPFARLGWDARAGEPLETRPLRRSLIAALGRSGDAAVIREAKGRFAARSTVPIDAAIRPAVFDVVGRYADEPTYRELVREMRTATEVEHKAQARSALRQMRDPVLLERMLGFMLRSELTPGDAVFNLTHLHGGPEQIEQGWRFVVANLPAVLAKAPPRSRHRVLPDAASGSNDPARASELLALTQAHLGPEARYQAEKTADFIRMKAAVKEREAKRALEWARAHLQ